MSQQKDRMIWVEVASGARVSGFTVPVDLSEPSVPQIRKVVGRNQAVIARGVIEDGSLGPLPCDLQMTNGFC